ncbi:hypothetical protein [Mesorhizobium sp. B263B2A]|uniref:hypothetical protein n=1 Tax=Mesorhizobium sp. B263B2A TaxID=2876669 RepID=UPI001CD0A313|nr:hypothetical protein [Mesorhizobium sp. B263B2A]MCA0032783.1 hypothetical protein [Mesorhizobium sp. B263B2A]
MDAITLTDPLVFFRDQDDGTCMAVIVAFTERNPKPTGIAEVITFNVLPSQRAAQNWAAETLGGPLADTVYVAPGRRS